MKIGVISDTHGFIDDRIIHHLAICDLIIHAGDVGKIVVTEQLSELCQLKCVFGNIDGNEIRTQFTEYLILEIERIKILLIHIAGSIGKYNPNVRSLLKIHRPEILICGHSHLLKVQKDDKFNLLYMNPGAAGINGFHKIRTLLRFDINDQKVSNLEVVELGLRSAKTVN